jgi:hypothetical protein
MKKVIRLTESDIVRLVKKVLIENKKLLKENPAYVGSVEGNFNIENLVAVQWRPEIEVFHKNGYKNKVPVKATISKGGFDIMSNRDVNMYNMWGTNEGGIGAQIVTGDCGKVGVPACLSQVELTNSETFSLTQYLKDFKQFVVVKDNVPAEVPGFGKVNVKVTLYIG